MFNSSFHFQTLHFTFILKFDYVLVLINVKFNISTLNMTTFYASVGEVLGGKCKPNMLKQPLVSMVSITLAIGKFLLPCSQMCFLQVCITRIVI
jgi:hypothetical protein